MTAFDVNSIESTTAGSDRQFKLTSDFFAEAQERLAKCARRMLHTFPTVRRWDETDDIWQTTAMRLHRSLKKSPPLSERAFYAMAATQMRWTLIDLARKYKGPESFAANHETSDGLNNLHKSAIADGIGIDDSPVSLAEWTEFHERVERLPHETRSAFDLIFYSGLTQAKAAEILGLTERVVRSRWRNARRMLAREESMT